MQIDEECVRMLYATCFLPRQRNVVDQRITGRELLIRRNPAEISDLTDDQIRRECQLPSGNMAVSENTPTEENREIVENIEKNVVGNEEQQQQSGDCNVPLGVVDLFDEDNAENDDEAMEEMSHDSEPLFEEHNTDNVTDSISPGNEHVDQGLSTKKHGSREDSRELEVVSKERRTDSVSGGGITASRSNNKGGAEESGGGNVLNKVPEIGQEVLRSREQERTDREKLNQEEETNEISTQGIEQNERRNDTIPSQDDDRKNHDEPESGTMLRDEGLETQANGDSQNCQLPNEEILPRCKETRPSGQDENHSNGQGGEGKTKKVCEAIIIGNCV